MAVLTRSVSNVSQWPAATAMRSVLGSLPGWFGHQRAGSGVISA